MKILMTTDTIGGVWTYSLELARALQPLGVTICLAAKGQPTPSQLEATCALPNVQLVARDYKLEWMDGAWQDAMAANEWLLDLAGDFRPAVIHLNDYSHGWLAWDAPVLITGHSCVLSWQVGVRGVESDDGWRSYRLNVTRGLRAADLVVAPTQQMLRALEYFYGPLPATRVISNGCDPARFQAGEKQAFIFSAGRFWDEAKNLRTLAAAAPAVSWPIAVAGLGAPSGTNGLEGIDISRKQLAGANAMEWLGPLEPDDMRLAYSLASIYALPALYEPFGLTALEAALSGCALVLGDIPTLREVWGDAACFVPPRDAQALAHSLNRLIADSAYRQVMAHRAQARARQYSATIMAFRYLESYRRLIAARERTTFVQEVR